jgi:hypothetical protein
MTVSAMTFHESYGNLTVSLLQAIKRFNVSPADYDALLATYGKTWDSPDIDYSHVEYVIRENSSSGMYRPGFPY